MGCGGREVTLEIFESYLKKLLHMIDKLPSVEKEKAVRIMKNSANHYYNLTLGEPLPIQVTSADFFSQEQSAIFASNSLLDSKQAVSSYSSNSLMDSKQTSIYSSNSMMDNNKQTATYSSNSMMENKQTATYSSNSMMETKQTAIYSSNSMMETKHTATYSSTSLLDTAPSPFSPLPPTESPSKPSCVPVSANSKLESEAILEEISGFAEGSQGLSCLGGNDDTAGSESWDRHLDINSAERELASSSSFPVSPRCLNCDTTFSCHREFNSHYFPVSCIGCKKEFCNKEIYLIHYHSCKGIIHYRVKFSTPSEPEGPNPGDANSNEKSGNKKHKCPQCELEFSTAFQLNKHIKGHNDNNCQKCDAKFAKRRFLVNHLKTVHYISTAEKYYNCKFCPRKFVKKPSLWAHYHSEHTVGSQVVCLKCGEIVDDSDQLEKHMEEHKTKARHTCEKCGDFFIRKQQYLAHLEGHDKHRCKICLKDFSSKKKLKHHRNFEHDPSNGAKKKTEKLPDPIKNPNFTCVVCLQNYKNEALFNSHNCLEDAKKKEKVKIIPKDVSIKLSTSKYKCRYCEFEHKKNSAVVRHARIHRNKKRFVCEQCGSAFNAHYTLKEHRIYVHSEDRKFNCTKCDKSFKARNALIRHEQVHSDKRPFACHCGQMFKRSSHLKRHLATSHKGEPEVARTEQSWEEEGSRYKTSWESPSKFGPPLSASVALDVVTSLDLNMKQDKEIPRPGKYEKEKRDGREEGGGGVGGQPLYHEEYRGYQTSHRYQGFYPGPGLRQEKEYEQDRLYQLQPQSVMDERGYATSHAHLERNSEPLFTDSGPADLSVSRAEQSQAARPRYSNYLGSSRPSYHHQPYSLRLPQVPGSLEPMEDPYQGYSQRQPSQYFDQLDSFLPPGREELELTGSHGQPCDKKKFVNRNEKYYRQDNQEVLGHPAHREEALSHPPHREEVMGHPPHREEVMGHPPHREEVMGHPPHREEVMGHPPHREEVMGHPPHREEVMGHPPHREEVMGHPPHREEVMGHPPHREEVMGHPPHREEVMGHPPHREEVMGHPPHREEVMGHPPHREEGLLPPLLALASHHGHGAPGNKMDYLCNNQADHYIQDSSMDYNITEY